MDIMINKYQMPKFMVLALHQESEPRNHTTKEKGTMKTLAISATLLLLAACAFAQAPVAPLQTPKTDVYVGIVCTYPDYGQPFPATILSAQKQPIRWGSPGMCR